MKERAFVGACFRIASIILLCSFGTNLWAQPYYAYPPWGVRFDSFQAGGNGNYNVTFATAGEAIHAFCDPPGPVATSCGTPDWPVWTDDPINFFIGTRDNLGGNWQMWTIGAGWDSYSHEKIIGDNCDCNFGNPVNIADGNKYQNELDFYVNQWLQFRRSYNSDASAYSRTLGGHWSHTYGKRILNTNLTNSLIQYAAGTYPFVSLLFPDGHKIAFQLINGVWTPDSDVADRLVQQKDVSGNVTGWTLFSAADRHVETYSVDGMLKQIADENGLATSLSYSDAQTPSTIAPAPGLLITVTDPQLRQLSFTYDSSSRVSAIKLPDGGVFRYSYIASNDVTQFATSDLYQVTYPDLSMRTYKYNETGLAANPGIPHQLTGIQDENNSRFASFGYDLNGVAISTSHAGGADAYSIHSDSQSATVTYPLGFLQRFSLTAVAGTLHVKSSYDLSCGATCGEKWASRSFDSSGYPQASTDFDGNTTCYTFDDTYGLETVRVEGVLNNKLCTAPVTGVRTIKTDWNTNFRLPTERRTYNGNVDGLPETKTDWLLNTRGQISARCDIDPAVSGAMSYTCGSLANAPTGVRQSKYTYCETGGGCPLVGQLLSIDGPRTDVSDVTTYTYFPGTDLSGCATLGGICHNIGDVQKVTNALGQFTTYVSYDKNGRVMRIQDANGTYTDMTYHPRGWLHTRTVRANANGAPNATLDATTTFAYDNVGNVTRVTQPDGAYLNYTYDAAHRLTDITDNLADTIHYTLDAAGNRTDEKTKDPSSTLKRELSRQYDQLNRLTHLQNAALADVQKFVNPAEAAPTGITYTDGYDSNANTIYSVDGNSVGTEQQYDPLNRLVKTLQDHAGIGATHDTTTQYAYDARNNLRSVIDPDNLTTSYTYDGLNNLTGLSSPDTGSTSYTYDAAGNRKTQTDARGVTSTYSYDALNRLTGISYPTSSNLNVSYTFDQANTVTGCTTSYPTGRLTTITDSSGSTTYCYDRRGNVVVKTQVTIETYSCNTTQTGCGGGGMQAQVHPLASPASPNPTLTTNTTLKTQYAYNVADRLLSITYPSGALVTYVPDPITGRINTVTYKATPTSTAVTILSSVSYYPFGPANKYTFGNGRYLTKTYDQNYAIASVASSSASGLVINAGVDVLGNLTSASNTGPPTQQYLYDPLYRLTSVEDGTNPSVVAYTYDKTGDRMTKSPRGQSAQSYTYTPGTHLLATVAGTSRTYDPNGNTLTGPAALSYDDSNRLSGWNLVSGQINLIAYSTLYGYSGRGERVSKQTMQYAPCAPPTCNPLPGAPVGWLTGTEAFSYSEGGQLIGEYPGTYSTGIGTEYIYLDATPIALVRSGALYYIETDQLDTPRQVIKPGATPASDTLMWKWDYFASNSVFGENTPSTQTITFNLRFPGQYYDTETRLNYNYFRDYEPGTGRYVESDPIGLLGGVTTYSYVRSNPTRKVDRSGLWSSVDLELYDWYLHGDGRYVDISAWCGDYLADPSVQLVSSQLRRRAENRAKELVGLNGTVDWLYGERNTLYVTSIYSFGSGIHHHSEVSCRFTGDGCCVTGACKLSYKAKDLFSDPYDLHQQLGVPMWLANNGTPFWFGLSCAGDSFTVKACRH